MLPFDETAARRDKSLVAGRERAGRPTSPFDAQIAAIAKVNKAKAGHLGTVRSMHKSERWATSGHRRPRTGAMIAGRGLL
ncbi:MAG: hypothetical protein MUF33_13610 [Candidatus Nanopelagicales bacterium]|jgi:predicted nucleic acid-binding protein|nr:hypothetical protein [Candidatus Nanopelagicales bacterium]MCU0299538.1 hypothetical protein [Candidatus Nanopelagicales bacterium]